MQAFTFYTISDLSNGILEVHFDKEIANAALQDFIEEGNAINKENDSAERAEDFFVMEAFDVSSLEDVAQWVGSFGLYGLQIAKEFIEKGLISDEEYLAAAEL